MRAPEVQQHTGMFVAVYNKCVVAAGTDQDAVLIQGAEKAQCPQEHLAVIIVPSADLFEIPH